MFIHALSLTQPWAILWDGVHKRYETRSWGTKHRGLLAIHASAHFPREVQALCRTEPFWSVLRALGVPLRWTTPPPEVLPLGVVVALTVLTDCAQIAEILPSNEAGGGLRVRLTRGGIWDISPQEAAFGTFAPGRWLWVPGPVIRLPQPRPAVGHLRLWPWDCPDSLLAASGLAAPAEEIPQRVPRDPNGSPEAWR